MAIVYHPHPVPPPEREGTHSHPFPLRGKVGMGVVTKHFQSNQ